MDTDIGGAQPNRDGAWSNSGEAGAPDRQITQDGVLDGRVILRQPRVGYRAGMDAAILAASLEMATGEQGLEAGCGAGGAMLQAAWRWPGARFLGLERDVEALDLAQESIGLNGMDARVEVQAWDIARPFAELGRARVDAAFANPPFFDDATRLRAPHPARRGAYLADGGLEAWTSFLLAAVRDGGRITLIHRADRLADLLSLLSASAGSFRIRPIQPFQDRPAKRVLVQARRGGRAPLALLSPLVLHQGDSSRHTARADSILRGRTALDWS